VSASGFFLFTLWNATTLKDCSDHYPVNAGQVGETSTGVHNMQASQMSDAQIAQFIDNLEAEMGLLCQQAADLGALPAGSEAALAYDLLGTAYSEKARVMKEVFTPKV
jgi:hypothetical protein